MKQAILALSLVLAADETVHAAYGVLSRNAGKVQLQAGLRAEHASRNFALVDAAEEFPYDYGSLFPSGVIGSSNRPTPMKPRMYL